MPYNPKRYWTNRQTPTKKEEVDHDLSHLIEKFLGDASSILDVGCGTGRLFHLYPRGIPVVGIDFVDTYSDQAVDEAIANELSFVHLFHDINDPFPFDDNQFSHCLAVKVLLHLEDPYRAMAEMARVSDYVIISDIWNEKEVAQHVFCHDFRTLLAEFDIHWWEYVDDHLNIIYSKP